jgi:hypothetical protein
VAGTLSRRSHSEQLSAVSAPIPSWLNEIMSSYQSDARAQDLLTKLAVAGASKPNFSLHQGLLRYKGRLWVGDDLGLQHKVIEAFHSSPVGGHSGFPATYHRIKHLFAWIGLKSAVQQFVAECPTCQQAKLDRARYPGLLQPLPIPSMAWQSISMDFIDGLPMSKGKNGILVIVDRFSKYAHFIPLADPFTTLTVAKLFFW